MLYLINWVDPCFPSGTFRSNSHNSVQTRTIRFKLAQNAGGAGGNGDKAGGRDRLGDAAAEADDDPVIGDLLEDDEDDDEDDDDDDGWNKLPIITFQTFDDLTSG